MRSWSWSWSERISSRQFGAVGVYLQRSLFDRAPNPGALLVKSVCQAQKPGPIQSIRAFTSKPLCWIQFFSEDLRNKMGSGAFASLPRFESCKIQNITLYSFTIFRMVIWLYLLNLCHYCALGFGSVCISHVYILVECVKISLFLDWILVMARSSFPTFLNILFQLRASLVLFSRLRHTNFLANDVLFYFCCTVYVYWKVMYGFWRSFNPNHVHPYHRWCTSFIQFFKRAHFFASANALDIATCWHMILVHSAVINL